MKNLNEFESLKETELTEINGGCGICDFIEDVTDAIIDAAMAIVEFALTVGEK
ncbi:ComC/BlpC family leader-containing pheromone/bacteriocin [Aquimarina algiphila]|uniref:ComC/BlpC family leader-containing pheromone/bacteriocin n=1 Tax=Aquimarina algiphila TaxID=2047982 RepID=UPI00248FCB62|nr:ComC/BlpC family leader-containing pheromone/bacteriocin [Aquimarina algiphila]